MKELNMEGSPIRFGIIGFGRFAERTILPALRASGVAEAIALQKRSQKEADAKAREYGVPYAFHRAADLVRHPEVDAVFIVSANAAHWAETLAAAAAGKHVLVEKPMAATVAQAQKMIRACRSARVKLMVGHMVRLSPVIVRMKQLIAEGSIGSLVHVHAEFFYDHRFSHRRWMFDRKVAGGGPVHDIGVHCLDTIRSIVADKVRTVRGVVSPAPNAKRTETTSAASIVFQKGVTASIYSSFAGPYRRSFIEVRGTDATLSAFDFTKSAVQVNLHIVRANNGEPLPPVVEPISVPDLYAEEIRLFVDSIRTRTDPPISGEEGLINQKILDQMLRPR